MTISDTASSHDLPSHLFTSRELEQIEVLALSNYQLAEAGEIPLESLSPALSIIAESYEQNGPGIWLLSGRHASSFVDELKSYRDTARMVYHERSGFELEDRLYAEDCVNVLSSILRKTVVRLV